jgi:hypothetical protein
MPPEKRYGSTGRRSWNFHDTYIWRNRSWRFNENEKIVKIIKKTSGNGEKARHGPICKGF